MQHLVDFLNHGLLPFSGRDKLLERILHFWRRMADSSGLGLQLIVGEAGIGKSRLVEELLPRIHHEGGLAVQTRLLPETSASILPLLARALWSNEPARYLLRSEPQETEGEILAALRRLARLRPLMLVIEDVHLLAGETLRELASLLAGLSDESLAVLCTARPLGTPLEDVVASYLVERVEIEGLGEREIADLWRQVFGTPCDRSSLASLIEATTGNPLALRSALRGALASHAIEPIGIDTPQRVRVDRKRFEQEVRRNAGRMASGMAAHLTVEENQAAEQLARLGEAFARESAQALLGDAEGMIERLCFRGILAPLSTPMIPLVGLEREIPDYPASAYPLLCFTHTLLHRHFLEAADPDTTSLARVVASGLPLFSLYPLQVILDAAPPRLDPEELVALLHRIRFVTIDMTALADYERAGTMLAGLRRLLENVGERLDPDERHDLAVAMLLLATGLDWYGEDVEEYERISQELLLVTENPQSAREAARRIAAVAKVNRLNWHQSELRERFWNDITDLAERFPELRFTHSYALSLALIANYAIGAGELERVREAEKRLHEMAADPGGKRLAAHVNGWLGPVLIRVFETSEELALRLEQMEELEATIDNRVQRIDLLDNQSALFTEIGEPARVLELVETGLPLFRQTDHTENVCSAQARRLQALVALGLDPEEARIMALRLLAEMPDAMMETARARIGAALAEAGMLRGETGWKIMEEFPEAAPDITDELHLLLGLHDAMPDEVSEEIDGDLAQVAHLIDQGSFAEAASVVVGMSEQPILRQRDILRLRLALALISRSSDNPDAGIVQRLRAPLAQGLLWLEQRRLHHYLDALIDSAGVVLPARENKAWRARSRKIEKERQSHVVPPGDDGRTAISMFGTIEIRTPEGEPKRVTGARMKAVLGLVVGAAIAERPLSHREFCAIATGEQDPDRARNVVYVRLHGLRELLGAEGIITDPDEAPRLNRNLVSVDLLEAHRLLLDARQAASDGALMRATPAVARALDIYQGDVPFPGLYEDFFEAAREDFENLMRGTLLRVVSDLMREGDMENAERLLRRGFEILPDDQEIAERFCEVLMVRGRRSEAERVRRVGR